MNLVITYLEKIVIHNVNLKETEETFTVVLVCDQIQGQNINPTSIAVSKNEQTNSSSVYVMNQSETKKSLIEIRYINNNKLVIEHFNSNLLGKYGPSDSFCIFDTEIIRWNLEQKKIWSSSKDTNFNGGQFISFTEKNIPLH